MAQLITHGDSVRREERRPEPFVATVEHGAKIITLTVNGSGLGGGRVTFSNDAMKRGGVDCFQVRGCLYEMRDALNEVIAEAEARGLLSK